MSMKTRGAKLCLATVVSIVLAMGAATTAIADDDIAQDALAVGAYAKSSAEKSAAQPSKAKGTVAKPKASSAYTKQTVPMKVDAATRKVLANGSYIIALAADTRNTVRIANGRVACRAGKTTVGGWKIEFEKSTQSYYITNTRTGKALTVSSKTKGSGRHAETTVVNGAKVYQSKLNKNNANQRWEIKSFSTGYIVKPKLNTTLALSFDAKGVAKAKKYKKGDTRKFWFTKTTGNYFLKSGTYTLSSDDGKLLTVPNMSIRNARRLAVAKNANNLGQVFDILYTSNGYYRIINVNSGKAVTANGKKRPLQKDYKPGRATQLWKAVLQYDGTVKFVNKKNAKISLMDRAWTISPAAPGINTVGRKALYRANKLTSKTKYAIVVDLTMHELFIFKKTNASNAGGPWKLFKDCRVSSGSHRNWTSARTSEISNHYYTYGGFNCFYWTATKGGGFLHSLLYASSHTPNRVTDGRLGMYISHGCIRMPIDYAKWIYDNCDRGTIVSRYYN